MNRIIAGVIVLLALCVSPVAAQELVATSCGAQNWPAGLSNRPFVFDKNGNLCTNAGGVAAPTNRSALITTGGTFQVAVPAGTYKSIMIENNNTNTDLCYVEDSGLVVATNVLATSVTSTNGATTAAKASATLAINGSYTQVNYTTSVAIVVTCATTGDSVYIRTQ